MALEFHPLTRFIIPSWNEKLIFEFLSNCPDGIKCNWKLQQ